MGPPMSSGMAAGARAPILSATASAPVSTRTTPGAACALLASTRLILARACGGVDDDAAELARQGDVADVVARALEEALVLDAAHRLPNPEPRHPGPLLDSVCGPTLAPAAAPQGTLLQERGQALWSASPTTLRPRRAPLAETARRDRAALSAVRYRPPCSGANDPAWLKGAWPGLASQRGGRAGIGSTAAGSGSRPGAEARETGAVLDLIRRGRILCPMPAKRCP